MKMGHVVITGILLYLYTTRMTAEGYVDYGRKTNLTAMIFLFWEGIRFSAVVTKEADNIDSEEAQQNDQLHTGLVNI